MELVTSARWFSLAVAAACLCVACAAGPAPAPGSAPAADDKPAGPPPEPAAATAVDAARDYTQRMKSDQPSTAIRTYWDMDAMLAGIFGEHLRRHTDAERAQMQRLLLDFVENVYASPKIAQAMKQATFEDFIADEAPTGGVTTVGFNVRIQDKVIPNSLRLKQSDGKWRIIDAGANGRMMVPTLRSQYEPQAQRLTPLDYIKAKITQVPGEKGNQGAPRQP